MAVAREVAPAQIVGKEQHQVGPQGARFVVAEQPIRTLEYVSRCVLQLDRREARAGAQLGDAVVLDQHVRRSSLDGDPAAIDPVAPQHNPGRKRAVVEPRAVAGHVLVAGLNRQPG